MMDDINREEVEVEETKNNNSKKRNIKGLLTELLIYALVAMISLFIIPKYVLQRTIVSGSSMESTLQSGDNLLVEKLSYHIGGPKRFDVVVFYPYGKEEEEYYVKRVIGLPGETVQIKGTDIYINGELLKENYGKDPIHYQGIAKNPITMGDDEYFLMGDNREVSFDSRYEDVGPVHANLIAGKAILRIWPINKFGLFE